MRTGFEWLEPAESPSSCSDALERLDMDDRAADWWSGFKWLWSPLAVLERTERAALAIRRQWPVVVREPPPPPPLLLALAVDSVFDVGVLDPIRILFGSCSSVDGTSPVLRFSFCCGSNWPTTTRRWAQSVLNWHRTSPFYKEITREKWSIVIRLSFDSLQIEKEKPSSYRLKSNHRVSNNYKKKTQYTYQAMREK